MADRTWIPSPTLMAAETRSMAAAFATKRLSIGHGRRMDSTAFTGRMDGATTMYAMCVSL